MTEKDIFNRVELLLGDEVMQRLKDTRVIVFGVGGVGSWTAEALARTGIGHMTIVDADRVAASNINRQLMATVDTVSQVKVDVLARRLLSINPELDLQAVEARFDKSTADDFHLQEYDYVVDAIDSLTDKALLISIATRLKVKLVSSMGAALKLDPTRIRVASFERVTGCRLAAALRRKFKQTGIYPSRKFKCVYSDELLPNRGAVADTFGTMTYGKVVTNGALCHITSIFGMTLAGLVIEGICKNRSVG
ncbi:MAG: tRNA threonylcarbamoyladenosine dehydratase [Bacteroides sp.]|nr:tRNA threonylcarbamoyladenosine dehydratase [Bacteroides sp.]MCM1412907.1 tRNA threonylcarbamoyladenosine dehydratase [Bacteroides sp.]MCM1471576.1 tRNA threonylcarbamoyladenosine dehydratase [Bacteroides sp.]